MRILVLCGSHRAARSEMMSNHGPNVVIRQPDMTVEKDGSTVQYFAARDENDANRLRGLRFDLIIEDGSFNYERSWVKGGLLHLIKALVLR